MCKVPNLSKTILNKGISSASFQSSQEAFCNTNGEMLVFENKYCCIKITPLKKAIVKKAPI